LLEGRGANSRGYEIAAKYMSTELSPWDSPRWRFGHVPPESAVAFGAPGRTEHHDVLIRNGKSETLVFRQDSSPQAIPRARKLPSKLRCVRRIWRHRPEQNYDDYKGIDVKGKIVAMVFEAPISNLRSKRTILRSNRNRQRRDPRRYRTHSGQRPILEGIYSFKERVRDLSRPGFAGSPRKACQTIISPNFTAARSSA